MLPATQQRWHSRPYPSRSWYSIKRPRRDARLSWPSLWYVLHFSVYGKNLWFYRKTIQVTMVLLYFTAPTPWRTRPLHYLSCWKTLANLSYSLDPRYKQQNAIAFAFFYSYLNISLCFDIVMLLKCSSSVSLIHFLYFDQLLYNYHVFVYMFTFRYGLQLRGGGAVGSVPLIKSVLQMVIAINEWL